MWRWCFASLLLLLSQPVWAADLSIYAVDGDGRPHALAQARASLQRTVPRPAPAMAHIPDGDPDALRYLLVGSEEDLPSKLSLESLDEAGRVLDVIANLPLYPAPCPAAIGAVMGACVSTLPIRAVSDRIDAAHPVVRDRSVLAVLGGTLRLRRGTERLGELRVSGPRRSPVGAIERYRARLRPVVVRLAAQRRATRKPMPVRRSAMRAALRRTAQLWAACGIDFGNWRQLPIEVMDPPTERRLVIGCGTGLPASGGGLRLLLDGKRFALEFRQSSSPREASRQLAAALRGAGYRVELQDNPPSSAGALASVDLRLRRADGQRATMARLETEPLSTDPTMAICLGQVNLNDGLQHFGNVDAARGTVEERTLLGAVADRDPTTIDLVVVPGFARGGRIGESFIRSDGGGLANIVVVDRAGLRANRRSFVVAHEIGHVLLDHPGHPDDYGYDLPSRLMDSDSADPTAFGPRRLSLEECADVIRQSGPDARLPLLEARPLD